MITIIIILLMKSVVLYLKKDELIGVKLRHRLIEAIYRSLVVLVRSEYTDNL